jgi:hypothetical protein
MVSTFTPNVQLEEPARGDYAGTWDTPVNNNISALDSLIGGVTTVTLTSTSSTLPSSQAIFHTLILQGTPAGPCTLTFPSSITKAYTIYNLVSNPANYVILRGGSFITTVCPPPYEVCDVLFTGNNFYYRNLGRIGELFEYGGTAVPLWVSQSTPPPFLNCDGTTFSAVTYPMLNNILVGNTLPDLRGVTKCTLNQGINRMVNVINGNTNLTTGGTDIVSLTAAQIPYITSVGSNTLTVYPAANSGYYYPVVNGAGWVGQSAGGGPNNPFLYYAGYALSQFNYMQNTQNISVTSNNTSGASHSSVQPTTICGITMIRAA